MTSIFAEAWSDARKDMRRGARRWLRRHYVTNFAAWGATTVLYTLPKAAIVRSHRSSYKKRVTTTGHVVTAGPQGSTTTTTVTSTSTSGAVTQTVTTTSTSGTGVIHMSATHRLLGTGDLARAYSTIIDLINAWGPRQGYAANSILNACADLEASLNLISTGLDDLNLTFQLGNIDKRVRDRVTSASNCIGNAGESMKRAREAMGRIYADQIHQEASGVPMAGAGLVAGGQYPPLETQIPAARAALLISARLPEQGNVVNGVWTHLATNKYAMSLWGRTLTDLSACLERYRVHRGVREHIEDAANKIKAAGMALHGTQVAFMRLYQAQGNAEATGATVIPIGR
jgi:hypothetical protein